MYEVFAKLLNMSLTASILVLIVIILRFAIKRAPRKYICILWALVALRLICPFSISSSVSAYNILHQDTISNGRIEYFEYNGKTEKPQLTFEVPALVNDNISPDSMTVGTQTSGLYMPTLVYIWVIGVIGMLAYAVVSFAHLRKEVRASIEKEVNIFMCDDINSPFILGIIRPRIYLPSGISEEVKENVIAHERAHIKRLDYIWKPLGFVLLSVYWFNPVMWIAYIFLCKDIETACDEKVISKMDKNHIASYSQALLVCASQRRMITACPIAFGETDVKGRIRKVLNYKKPAFWIIIASIIVCIIVGICFLTNPKGNNIKLLENASPSTSAMSFHYFDGKNTEIKWLYDEKEEQKIIDEINNVVTKKGDSSLITEFTAPCYGLEITDKDGYMIWLTYCNGLWLSKDGSIYEADYNFEKLYNNISSDSSDIISGGAGMTNAGLLGEYDTRYYSIAPEMSSMKDGVELSISAIEGNTVTVLIQNNSSEDFIYGTYYSLNKEIDGVWYVLPPKLSNYGFTDIAMILSGGESKEEQCDLTMYGELSDGHYRIEKAEMVAEFTISGKNAVINTKKESSDATDSEGISWNGNSATYSDYVDELIFNFGGRFFLSDAYTEPIHEDYTPTGWYALGGEGKCIDPSYAEKETFRDGKLVAYNWVDNHSICRNIIPFSAGEYSCCLYQYSFDLFTAPDLELNPDVDPTSEYWVVFYTEGEGRPLYIKYFNCDYFSYEQALENIVPGVKISFGKMDEENLGITYREHPITHEYTIDGDMICKYKKSLIGKDPKSEYSIQYIVLTNEEDITWEEINERMFSTDISNWPMGTIIIGINIIIE